MDGSEVSYLANRTSEESKFFELLGRFVAEVHEIYEEIFQIFCDVLDGDFDKAKEIFDILGDRNESQISFVNVYIKRIEWLNDLGSTFIPEWTRLRAQISLCHERRGWVAHSKLIRPGGNMIISYDEESCSFKFVSSEQIDKFKLEKTKRGSKISTDICQLSEYIQHATNTKIECQNFRTAIFNNSKRGKAFRGEAS